MERVAADGRSDDVMFRGMMAKDGTVVLLERVVWPSADASKVARTPTRRSREGERAASIFVFKECAENCTQR